MGDENLRRIASRAFKDIMPSKGDKCRKVCQPTRRLKGVTLQSIENLDSIKTFTDCPIPAPKPVAVPVMNCRETSIFKGQQKEQQKFSYSSKPHFPVKESSYTSLSVLTANSHWPKTTRNEEHHLTLTLSQSIGPILHCPIPAPKPTVIQSISCWETSSAALSDEQLPIPASKPVAVVSPMSYWKNSAELTKEWVPIPAPKPVAVSPMSSWETSTELSEERLPIPAPIPASASSVSCCETSSELSKEWLPSPAPKPASASSMSCCETSSELSEEWLPIPAPKPAAVPACNQQNDHHKLKSITDETQQIRYVPDLPLHSAQELQTSHDVGFIDTHCHLDFLFKRSYHNGSFEAYRKTFSDHFPVSYEGCVTVFCHPHTFAAEQTWKHIIEEDGVWAAFGCHPHNAMEYTEKIHSSLITALEHNKVVALGEIGLDYSNRNNCPKAIQHQVFKKQLKLAVEKKLPLVIHNRDAFEDCLEIMKKHVPLNHKIHLHCCTDPWEVAKTWLDTFPNLYIGLTNVVTYSTARNVHDIARNIPLDRLLLETDAPYFVPSSLPRNLRSSHPGMAIHVAAEVSVLKQDVTLKEVLRTVRLNTMKMYGI